MRIEEEKKEIEIPNAESMGILFPNICQSLHLGCNNYDMVKNSALKSVNCSHSDA
jgi:hypothetical protein